MRCPSGGPELIGSQHPCWGYNRVAPTPEYQGPASLDTCVDIADTHTHTLLKIFELAEPVRCSG